MPSAFALRTLRTGYSPLDRGFEVIGNVFNIKILERNEFVRVGIAKFLLYIIVFTLVHYALRKKFDNRPATVIAAAFSAFIFFLPRVWFTTTGNVLAAIIGISLYIVIAVAAIYFAFKVFNGETTGVAWADHMIGIVILITAMILIEATAATLVVVPLLHPQLIEKIRNRIRWQ